MEFLRALMTVLAMAAFFAILWWAYAPARKAQWQRRGELGDDA
jgi:cbb3-type cytochrome oxidase subunit 3